LGTYGPYEVSSSVERVCDHSPPYYQIGRVDGPDHTGFRQLVVWSDCNKKSVCGEKWCQPYPGAGHAEHGPAAVDDLALGVLLVVEGDDGGLAAAGVDAELGVQVRGRGGAELGHLVRAAGGCGGCAREEGGSEVMKQVSRANEPREGIRARGWVRSCKGLLPPPKGIATYASSRHSPAARTAVAHRFFFRDDRSGTCLPRKKQKKHSQRSPWQRSGRARRPWCGAPRRGARRSVRSPWRRRPWTPPGRRRRRR
jgi:hypothetical protein